MASVLIIHESGDICHSLSPVIGRNGHACTAFSSCAAALEALKTTAHDIAIIDIDVTENPEQAISALARTKCRPHILVITNGGNPEVLEQAIRAGAWDVICTPFTGEELEQAINRCLFHRRAKRETGSGSSIQREAILGVSHCLDQCLDNIATAAHTNASVLILGETGTGKELFANAIHENSSRSERNFIVVDCTNIPKTLAESLLFGHERGSFTGAADSRDGLFKQADGGTIFLDEIGDLDFEVQKSLLRVLQERRFRPLSSKKEIASDFRLVAATNRNLEAMVKQGAFRKDLYHRLRTRVIHLPPLRERKEDILPIANFHVRNICAELECVEKEISFELHHALTLYDWPGNVRELINILHATVHNGIAEYRLYPQHLPLDIRTKVLLKRSNKPVTGGYLVTSKTAPCCAHASGEPACPLLATPGIRDAHDQSTPIEAVYGIHGTTLQNSPSAPSQALQTAPASTPAPEGLVGSPTQHRPGNGFAHIEGPYVKLPMDPDSRPEQELLPLRTVRELAMQEVESTYLKRLITQCQGNFQRALTMSGLSRARLYDLLHKHSMSIGSGE